MIVGVSAAVGARRFGMFAPPRDRSWFEAARAGDVTIAGRLDGPVRQTRRGWRTRLTFSTGGIAQKAQVWLPKGRSVADLEPGKLTAISGKLRPPRRPRNPGDFDEAAALAAAGCGWVLHARVVAVSSSAVPAVFLPWVWAQRARLSAEEAYRRRLPAERAALLAGIALGDAGALSDELARAVRDAGATHLLVASGSNVGFAAAAALLLGLAAGLRPPARGALALALAGFYTLMAGADPPCVRSWVMLAAVLTARGLGRETTGAAALTFAAAVLLLVDPASALSPSAVMSVGACAAILWAGSAAERAVPESWPSFARAGAVVFLGSIAVAVALWPLWIEVFGRASLVGPLVNIILVPLSGPLLAGGFALWAADAWLPVAAPTAARLAGAGLWLFERTCVRAAALPWAAVELRPWTHLEIAAWCLFLAAILAWPRRRACLSFVFSAAAVLLVGRALKTSPPVSVLFLTDGSALARFNGGPAVHLGPKPPHAVARRAARVLGAGSLECAAVGGPWILRLGRVSLLIGNPSGSAVRSGDGAFAIIEAPRAFEVVTDGDTFLVQDPLRPGVRLGSHFPQRGQARFVTDAVARALAAQGARRERGDGGAKAHGPLPAQRRLRDRVGRRRHDAGGGARGRSARNPASGSEHRDVGLSLRDRGDRSAPLLGRGSFGPLRRGGALDVLG